MAQLSASEPPTKTSKYGNLFASSSNEEAPKQTEGFILPPKKVSKEPSSDFMGFCNNVMKNSRVKDSKTDDSFGFKPNYQHHFDEDKKRHDANIQLDYNFPLDNFIVVRLSYLPDESPCEILNRSAGFCKMPTVWEYKGNNICFIKVDGFNVCEDTRADKQEARNKAAAKALQCPMFAQHLSNICTTFVLYLLNI